MKSMWNEPDRAALLRRLESLRPETQPLWGTLTCTGMVQHLTRSFRMALGDLAVEPMRTPFRRFPLKQLAVYVLPVPRGVRTAPKLVPADPGEWAAEFGDLRTWLARFGGSQDRTEWPSHPAFGAMTRRGWGTLVHRHVDHHLRQFGA